jgi:purine-cytosine permease-like protein
VAGRFGIVAGLIAGFAHVAMTLNIGYLHGGMNLYNNGFSGGFIAATLVPLFSAVSKKRGKRIEACREDEVGPESPYRDLE